MTIRVAKPVRGRFDLQLAFAGSLVGLVIQAALLARLCPDQLVCPLRALTGLPCATCGATRAGARLWHLDFAGAFAYNPLVVLTAAGAVLFVLHACITRLLGWRRISVEIHASDRWPMCIVLGSAVLANWVYLFLHGV